MSNTMDANAMTPALPMDSPSLPPLPPEQPAFGNRPPDGTPLFDIVRVIRQDGTSVPVEYVSIITPGDPKATPRRKVTDALRQKYAHAYRSWRTGMTTAPEGTPLEMWARLASSPAIVADLKYINIFTIEQLAGVADGNLHRLPMGPTLKNDAKAWLADRKDTAALEAQRRETDSLREGNAMMQGQMQVMMQQMAEMQAKLAATEAPKEPEVPKRGPGRPPRAPAGNAEPA